VNNQNLENLNMAKGPGKKKCPKCNKEFGQAKKECDKPGCGYKFPRKTPERTNTGGEGKVAKSGRKQFNKAEYAKAAVLYALNISGKKGYDKPAAPRPTQEQLKKAIRTSKAEADRLVELDDEWDVYDCANKLSEAVRKDLDLIMKDYQ
jgi:hypothetical protein